jgi:hypothetical protein
MTLPRNGTTDELPPTVRLAFAPLHKRALGMAVGIASGTCLSLLTLFETLRQPEGQSPLALLSQYFAGYTVSVTGAFVALLWGFATGFIIGWFLAFCRNLVVAASIFWIRTRADLRATRDFLDHI